MADYAAGSANTPLEKLCVCGCGQVLLAVNWDWSHDLLGVARCGIYFCKEGQERCGGWLDEHGQPIYPDRTLPWGNVGTCIGNGLRALLKHARPVGQFRLDDDSMFTLDG